MLIMRPSIRNEPIIAHSRPVPLHHEAMQTLLDDHMRIWSAIILLDLPATTSIASNQLHEIIVQDDLMAVNLRWLSMMLSIT